MKKGDLVLILGLLAACEDSRAPNPSAGATEPSAVPAADIDSERYILAADLFARFDGAAEHFVFDVRNRAAYDESHIRGALSLPYGQFDQPELDAIGGLSRESPIVTYCGCPHHLAGLAADLLIDMGYRNVRVLYEGYWYWRDHDYPTAGLNNLLTTELQFSGTLSRGGRALEQTDLFIRNLRNGQLEAARTDASGRYRTGFHVLGYRPDDLFELRIGNLNAPAVGRMRADPGRINTLPSG